MREVKQDQESKKLSGRLTTQQLMQLWDTAQMLPPYQRAEQLVRATVDAETLNQIHTWTIGQRDFYLFQLRAWLFGAEIESVTTCINCAETVELNFSTEDLAPPQHDLTAPLHFNDQGYDITFRLPMLADLQAIATANDVNLLQRCITDATYHEKPVSSAQLPPSIITHIAEHIAEVDQYADVQFVITCPNCGETWRAPFDIVDFLWREITHWTQRIQRDVHIIASAYGWVESEILRLSPARRQAYIQLILGIK